MSEELSDDACIALALLVGATFVKNTYQGLYAAVCEDTNHTHGPQCKRCEPRTWKYLGRETKGAAARLYCENHKLLATSGVTP